MKKALILSILATICTTLLNAQIVNIPDPIFKDFLVNHFYYPSPTSSVEVHLDANGDGEIQYSEAASYIGSINDNQLYLPNLGISDLTGIEAFKSIKKINANDNLLTSIDVDGCTSLEELSLFNNPMGAPLVINNSSLKKLSLGSNTDLPTVDLTGCTALENLICSDNDNLTDLNLNGCQMLEEIRVSNNPLLTTVSLSSYFQDKLTYFQGVNNALTAMDFSKCSSLSHLQIDNNKLTSLNLANGNSQSFGFISATGNPNLICIEVDDPYVADALWGDGYPYEFDPASSFDTDCTPAGPCVVYIPDTNFKAFLLADASINTDENNEIECAEAIAYTGEINLDGIDISDWTGIEAFVNITSFSSNNNQTNSLSMYPEVLDSLNLSNFNSLTSISCVGNVGLEYLNASGCTALTNINVNASPATNGVSVDLTGCTALTNLNLINKKLKALNLHGCTALERLDCSDNQLNTLSLSGCTQLNNIDCSNNELSILDVSVSTALDTLNCSNNQLNDLVTTNNTNLIDLDCGNNQLTNLLISPNTALTSLKCNDNNISYLDVGNNALLEYLNCNNNDLNSISVNDNPVLKTLLCNFNNLTTLNVSDNTDLTLLACNNNQLSDIDVSENLELKTLRCNNNNLPNIDVSNNLALEVLWCTGNDLPNIDVSNNLNLRELDCSFNQLTNLDLSANNGLITLSCADNQLTTLDLENNPSLTSLTCTNNELVDLDVSQTYLHVLYCESNDLQTLNLANGHNANAAILFANDNPNLTCIEVDDPNFSTTNWTGGNFNFDAGVSFSTDCSSPNPCIVTIPDANFKAALLANTSINTDGNNEIECAEAIVYTGEINVENLAILDLTGIEEFVKITGLNCSDNQLSTLDISNNPDLTLLNCSNNDLTSIDVSDNANLEILRCDNNNLSDIDVSNNTALSILSFAENNLLNVDVSNNSNLEELNGSDNQLSELNVSVNSELFVINCSNNQLTDLDLSNTKIKTLSSENNNLEVLNLANGHNTEVISILVNNNPNLTCIQVDDVGYSTANWTGSNFVFDTGVSFSVNCELSIETNELENSDLFVVYPNPTNGKVHFSEKVNLKVTNLVGQIIYNEQNSKSIDLSPQPSGLYIITFTDNNGQKLQQSKIVKK